MGRLMASGAAFWVMSLAPAFAVGIIGDPIVRNEAAWALGLDAYPISVWDGQEWLLTSRQVLSAIEFLLASGQSVTSVP